MALSSIDVNLVEGDARPLTSGPKKPLIIGVASGGTKETNIYTFGDIRDVQDDIGDGPATVASGIMLALAPAGYKSIDVLVASGSIAATSSSYTQSNASFTLSGTPYDTYDFRLEITKAGGNGTAKFKYSLDGGNTYSTNNLIPTDGVFAIPNTGLTLSGSGTQTEGGTATFVTTAPEMNSSDVISCMETYRTSNRTPTLILLANTSVNAASASSLLTQLNTSINQLDETHGVYTQGILFGGGESFLFNRSTPTSGTYSPSAILQEITGTAATEIVSVATEKVNVNVAEPFAGYGRPRLPTSFVYAAECHAVGGDISKNPAQDPLRLAATPSRDEFQNGEVYSEFKLVAPRTYPGEAGIFIDQSHLKLANGSSFDIWPKGRVINEARRITREALRPWIHERVRTIAGGKIDPRDKQIIEDAVNKKLRAALLNTTNGRGFQGHCTDVAFTVNDLNDVLTTSTLEGSTLIVPFAYPNTITVNASFTTSIAVAPTTGA